MTDIYTEVKLYMQVLLSVTSSTNETQFKCFAHLLSTCTLDFIVRGQGNISFAMIKTRTIFYMKKIFQ